MTSTLVQLALCLLHRLNRPVDTLTWVSDNTSAIKWAYDNKCKSPVAQLACMFVTWFLLRNGIRLQVQHRAGVDMGDIDKLSRFQPHSFPQHLEILAASIPGLDELFLACHVLHPSKDVVNHHTAFMQILAHVQRFP